MGTTDDTNHYEGALLEAVRDDIRRLAEAMADVPHHVRSIDERLTRVESDIKLLRAVADDISSNLNDHEARLTDLEQATA